MASSNHVAGTFNEVFWGKLLLGLSSSFGGEVGACDRCGDGGPWLAFEGLWYIYYDIGLGNCTLSKPWRHHESTYMDILDQRKQPEMQTTISICPWNGTEIA